MGENSTFTVEEMSVVIEESADALTYTFTPQVADAPRGIPLVFVLFFLGIPLGLLGLVGYALDATNANRPDWERILTGVFAAQLLGYAVMGTILAYDSARLCLRHKIVLTFTPSHVWHGGVRVSELTSLRGLRLFTYNSTRVDLQEQRQACLSFVFNDDSGTHGLFGGFREQSLRALAGDIYHRLAAFRFNQGIVESLEPLSVVETTEDEAGELMQTRPASDGGLRMLASRGFKLIQHRWGGTLWCLAMLAGLYASGRLILAAGAPAVFQVGHGILSFIHFAFLLALWAQPNRPEGTGKTD